MQGTGSNRRVIGRNVVAILLVVVFVLFDQITKIIFKTLDGKGLLGEFKVVDGFFYFRYTENSGAAFSFLAGKSWSQTFFKILTVIALAVFIVIMVYACKRDYKFLRIGMSLVISGTVGNFIDRVLFNAVSDFLNICVNGVSPFGIFNFADVFLCVGVPMIIIHCLFLDENAVFKKNDNK